MSGSQNTISGSVATIKHYIGEMYFLRAYEYFKKLQLFGDFPIINQPLADEMEALREASNVFRVMKWHVSSFPILTRLMPI